MKSSFRKWLFDSLEPWFLLAVIVFLVLFVAISDYQVSSHINSTTQPTTAEVGK